MPTTIESPKRVKPRQLPPWKVLLHNDDQIEFEYAVETLMALTPLNEHESTTVALEAHREGVGLIMETHRERAELLQEQFESKRMKVSIEPAGG